MTEFNNGLTPAQAERLALLAEECGEVVQAVAKILRHGYRSYHPDTGVYNVESLTREVGDLQAVVSLMMLCGDMEPKQVTEAVRAKLKKLRRWTHHQDADALSALQVAFQGDAP